MFETDEKENELTLDFLRNEGATLEDFLRLHVMSLRIIGRALGINDNASIKKEELASRVSEIVDGIRPLGANYQPKNCSASGNTLANVLKELKKSIDERKILLGLPVVEDFRGDKHSAGESEDDSFTRVGVLDMISVGDGYLRGYTFLPGVSDVFVPREIVRANNLRMGDFVCGQAILRADNVEQLIFVKSVTGADIRESLIRPNFDNMEAAYPTSRFEMGEGELTLRALQLLAPIGRGQRVLVSAKRGRERIDFLKKLLTAIKKTAEDVECFTLLIGGRAEEISSFKRANNTFVVSCGFDKSAASNAYAMRLVLAHAKRIAESGKHAVIILDSLTSLLSLSSRAKENSEISGETCFDLAREIFGSARALIGEGSLTVIATNLTGGEDEISKSDLQFFSDAANCRLYLREDEELSLKDCVTEDSEFILKKAEQEAEKTIRKSLKADAAAEEMLLTRIANTRTNEELIKDVKNFEM